MTSGRALGLALAGPHAIRDWRQLIGPTKAYRTAWEQPECLRAQLGLGDTRNGFHGSGTCFHAHNRLDRFCTEGAWARIPRMGRRRMAPVLYIEKKKTCLRRLPTRS